jgi:hypothetical protein
MLKFRECTVILEMILLFALQFRLVDGTKNHLKMVRRLLRNSSLAMT